MRKPGNRVWSQSSWSTPLTNDATPPASLALLTAAVTVVEDAATTPYAGCGRLFDGCGAGTSASRYVAMRIAPGAQHARAHITLSMDWAGSVPMPPWTFDLTSATGGTTGTDVARVTQVAQFAAVNRALALAWNNIGYASIQSSGEHVDDAPAAVMDRQLELAAHPYPYTEQLSVTNAAGVCFWVSERVTDLETLT